MNSSSQGQNKGSVQLLWLNRNQNLRLPSEPGELRLHLGATESSNQPQGSALHAGLKKDFRCKRTIDF